MPNTYRLLQRGSGTFTSHRLISDGVWLNKVEHLGNAVCLGEFLSPEFAKDKAIELLAGEPGAIYLVCNPELTIIHHVFNQDAQDKLERQRRRSDSRAKFVIGSIIAVVGFILLWNHGLLTLSPMGIVTALAVPALCWFVASTFNPVETVVALGILLILLALSLPVAAKLRARSSGKADRPLPAATR